jgi:hypothetical protein
VRRRLDTVGEDGFARGLKARVPTIAPLLSALPRLQRSRLPKRRALGSAENVEGVAARPRRTRDRHISSGAVQLEHLTGREVDQQVAKLDYQLSG